jgi:predicted nuclease of predicted toxin-antitoxin system
LSEFRFLADMHVSLAALDEIQARGIDVLRTLDVGFEQDEDDLVLLEYATSQKRVMITCDRDFEQHAYEWLAEGKSHASILYLDMATGDCQNIGLILHWVELIYGASDPDTESLNQIWRAK